MKNKKEITLGSLIDRFKKIYGLADAGLTEHEGVHAMTGMSISVADEMRVAVYEIALTHPHENNRELSLKDALQRKDELHKFLTRSLKYEWTSWIEENKLATARFRRIQAGTLPLDNQEVKEQFALAKKMNQAVLRLTGKSYRELTATEVSCLNFRDLDFTAEAYAIKRRHEKPENRKIEEATARFFFRAAKRKGRGADIPAPGTPWCGPHKRVHPAL